MSGIKAKKYVLARHFEGEPKSDDLKLVEEDLPELEVGEILCEALCFSVDPYMRPYSRRLPAGATMIGSQVAKVVKTRNGEYPLGTHVVAYFGWRTHTVVNPDKLPQDMFGRISPLPDMMGLPVSLALGAVGMPGNTAYFGFLELCQPKEGEVVVVSGAAGAVGSLVGQIAKIKGCHVIGYAGSDEKVNWLKELGFDHAFNYKKVDLNQSLKEAAPNGVDCYFDNVGGLFSAEVLNHMRDFGRISVCGSISNYNDDPSNPTLAPAVQPNMVFKQLRMEGFLVHRWLSRWMEGCHQMRDWILEGKIKYHETWTEGFENMPTAFMDMLKGGNVGKALVRP